MTDLEQSIARVVAAVERNLGRPMTAQEVAWYRQQRIAAEQRAAQAAERAAVFAAREAEPDVRGAVPETGAKVAG